MSGASVKMTAVARSTFLYLRAAVVRSRTELKGDASGSPGSPTSERPCPPLLYPAGRACRPPSSRPRGGGEPYRRAKAPKSGEGIEPGTDERSIRQEAGLPAAGTEAVKIDPMGADFVPGGGGVLVVRTQTLNAH